MRKYWDGGFQPALRSRVFALVTTLRPSLYPRVKSSSASWQDESKKSLHPWHSHRRSRDDVAVIDVDFLEGVNRGVDLIVDLDVGAGEGLHLA